MRKNIFVFVLAALVAFGFGAVKADNNKPDYHNDRENHNPDLLKQDNRGMNPNSTMLKSFKEKSYPNNEITVKIEIKTDNPGNNYGYALSVHNVLCKFFSDQGWQVNYNDRIMDDLLYDQKPMVQIQAKLEQRHKAIAMIIYYYDAEGKEINHHKYRGDEKDKEELKKFFNLVVEEVEDHIRMKKKLINEKDRYK